MKTRMEIGLLVCVVLFSGPASVCVYGQAPVITSFHQNGELTWSGPAGTNAYRVEWASDLTGTPTWYRNWWDLKYIVSAAPVTAASVPMFYRVVQDVNEYSNASLSNAWFVVMPVESIYMIGDGDGTITEHSGFSSDTPAGYYQVYEDGSLYIIIGVQSDHDVATVGQFMPDMNEIAIQPPFLGERLKRVTDLSLFEGAWSGALTEVSPTSGVKDISFNVSASGGVTNFVGLAGPVTGRFFALSDSGGMALGCFRTGEPYPYNQVSLRGALTTNTASGDFALDISVGNPTNGTFLITRP